MSFVIRNSLAVCVPLMFLAWFAGRGCAQTLEVKVEQHGRISVVSARVDDVFVRDVFVELASHLGTRLRLQPGAPEAMEGQSLPVRVERMPVTDFVGHLAGAIGLEGVLEDGALEVRTVPAETSDDAVEWARKKALDAWMRSSIAVGTGSGSDTLYLTGLLCLAGGEWTRAITALERFAVVSGEDGRAPRALLLASDAALRSGDVAQHEALIDRIVREYVHIDEVMHAHLRKVRLLIDRQEYDVALPLLRRVEDGAQDDRLHALAVILRADLWYARGDGAKSMEVLATFDVDSRRDHPDLAANVPLYEGISLIRADEHERAMPRLQVCLLSERTELRVRAALAIARSCFALDQCFAALQNVHIALRHETNARVLVEAHLLEAEILVKLGLEERALRAYERVAGSLPPDAPDALQMHLIEGMADVLYRRRAFEEALKIWSALSHRRGREGQGRFQAARCLIALKRHEDAITQLDRIPADSEGVDADEVARMRGKCFLALGDFAKAAMSFGSSSTRSGDQEDGK
jgi:tetratricopeptide (TPR) repeat protein